ncbi:hypothetical protein BKK54_01785 [Rodentibacter genomosp. 1]|uniref:Uncharacterized protein n=1 Tax=Rodentibacter genomosp. 1 TaxID=1908264 RepID=A0A1V3J8J5_9PAST|nr:hypothetical protein [Rodentibacter genomosp. 1]OOF51733.1 hypothetical protein BKK54_01785 [Rodentibacter genomosp. 1]
MNNQEILHKEIELIQTCINRMANNSFLLKGWTVSLITVILALTNISLSKYAYLALFIPLISFWYLDAFFLRKERMYREMYSWVLENRSKSDEHIYNLNPHRFDGSVKKILSVFLSKTLLIFYGSLMFTLIIWILFIFKLEILAKLKTLCLFIN